MPRLLAYNRYVLVHNSVFFLQLGLKPSHAVVIIGFNACEWHISCLGAMFAG